MNTPYPKGITLESTNVCNIIPPCVMCNKHINPSEGYLRSDGRHFPEHLLEKLKPVLAQCISLTLHGVGEPLSNPRLLEIADMAPRTAYVGFVSNGWLVKQPMVERILASNVKMIDFSLDASSPKVYERIRHGDFLAVKENIANFIAQRNKAGQPYPHVFLNMCLMRENIADLPGLVQLCHDIGATGCYGFHLNEGAEWQTEWFDYANQHCFLDPVAHNRCVEAAFALSAQLDVRFQFKGQRHFNESAPAARPPAQPAPTPSTFKGVAYTPYLEPPPYTTAQYQTVSPGPEWTCPMPWANIIVFSNGGVTNCCWQGGYLGSLNDKTFDEVWNGPRATEIRQMTAKHQPHPQCALGLPCPHLGRR